MDREEWIDFVIEAIVRAKRPLSVNDLQEKYHYFYPDLPVPPKFNMVAKLESFCNEGILIKKVGQTDMSQPYALYDVLNRCNRRLSNLRRKKIKDRFLEMKKCDLIKLCKEHEKKIEELESKLALYVNR